MRLVDAAAAARQVARPEPRDRRHRRAVADVLRRRRHRRPGLARRHGRTRSATTTSSPAASTSRSTIPTGSSPRATRSRSTACRCCRTSPSARWPAARRSGCTARSTRPSAASIPAFPTSEDTDFCIRAHLAGYRLHFVPEAVYNYRLRDDLGAIRGRRTPTPAPRRCCAPRYMPPARFLARAAVADLGDRDRPARRRRLKARATGDPRDAGAARPRRRAARPRLRRARRRPRLPRAAAPAEAAVGDRLGAHRREAAGADLRRRPRPRLDPAAPRRPRPARREGDLLHGRPPRRAPPRARRPRRRRGPRDRQPQLGPSVAAGIGVDGGRRPARAHPRRAGAARPGAAAPALRPPGPQGRPRRAPPRLSHGLLAAPPARTGSTTTPRRSPDTLLDKVEPGAIVLLHDSLYSLGGRGRPRPRARRSPRSRPLIERLPDWRFVTVSELMRHGAVRERVWENRPAPGFRRGAEDRRACAEGECHDRSAGRPRVRVGISGSGFVARALAAVLVRTPDFAVDRRADPPAGGALGRRTSPRGC